MLDGASPWWTTGRSDAETSRCEIGKVGIIYGTITTSIDDEIHMFNAYIFVGLYYNNVVEYNQY